LLTARKIASEPKTAALAIAYAFAMDFAKVSRCGGMDIALNNERF
jgi:hypothetical protein